MAVHYENNDTVLAHLNTYLKEHQHQQKGQEAEHTQPPPAVTRSICWALEVASALSWAELLKNKPPVSLVSSICIPNL